MLKRHGARQKRRGEPFTVYFTKEQSARLRAVSRERHVSKAALVRFAIDRLLDQWRGGQLELPLGL
jgi:hypothetical protein